MSRSIIDINNTDTFVTCQVCLEKMKKITWRHLARHQITSDTYLHKYPDCKMECVELTSKHIIKMNTRYAQLKILHPEIEIARINKLKQTLNTSEYSNIRSNISKKLWNTYDYKRKQFDAHKNGIILSNDHKSISHVKGAHTKNKNGTCPFLSINRKVNANGKDIYAVKSMQTRLNNGWRPPHRYRHYWYNNIHLRSKPEIEFVQSLDKLKIPWKYEPTFFSYIGTDNLLHKYFPDFFIPKFGYIEYKPVDRIDITTIIKAEAVRKTGNTICIVSDINKDYILQLLQNLWYSPKLLSA